MLFSLQVRIVWTPEGKRRFEMLETFRLAGVRIPRHFTSDGPSIPSRGLVVSVASVATLAALLFLGNDAQSYVLAALIAMVAGMLTLPRTERYLVSAMLHDYVLRDLCLPWRESNRLMRIAMRETGVPWYDRWRVAAGIEIGRFLAWMNLITIDRS